MEVDACMVREDATAIVVAQLEKTVALQNWHFYRCSTGLDEPTPIEVR